MTTALLALWLAYPSLAIHGDSTCPTPAEVDQQLARLADPRDSAPMETSVQHQAYLFAGDGSVSIELVGPDGGVLAQRRLDRSASCSELAQTVAVVLAAWQARFSPTLALTAPEPPVPPAVSPPPPQPVLAPEAVLAARPKPGPKPPLVFDVGMGVLTSIAGGEAVVGAKLEGAVFPLAVPLGLDLALSLASTHTQRISSPAAEAQWMRPALSFGPALRWRGKAAAMVDVHAGGVLAVLRVQGAGALVKPASDASLQFGLDAGLRGLWTWTKGAAWLGADLLAFPGQDRLTIGNYGQVGQLPQVEVQLTFGFSLGRFR